MKKRCLINVVQVAVVKINFSFPELVEQVYYPLKKSYLSFADNFQPKMFEKLSWSKAIGSMEELSDHLYKFYLHAKA